MFTMLIDHIGAVWHPNDLSWRIIGRLALPFYIYTLVTGYFRTRDIKRYVRRIAILAVISQLPYQLAFQVIELNVIATLLVCLVTLLLLDRFQAKPAVWVIVLAAGILLLEALPFDYGAYALLLVLIYRYATPHWAVLLHLLVNILSVFHKGWIIQLFSLFATVWIVYLPEWMKSMDRIHIPRLIWRSFYPLHLSIIAVVHHLMNR